MAVITEVNNYVAKFLDLSHLRYDAQLVITCLEGRLGINLQQSLVPWEEGGQHGRQVHRHRRGHLPQQNHPKKVKPARIRRRQKRAKERADAELAAASASHVSGQNAPPSSRTSPCWPQHYQPQDLISTPPPPAPAAQADFQLCEEISSPPASPARVDSQTMPAVKATKCVNNSEDETLEVVAEEATISTPSAAGKADLPGELSLAPTVSLPPLQSAKLISQDHNPPEEVVVAEEATKVELVVSARKRRKLKQPSRNMKGLQQLQNISPILPSPSRPSRAMSTPVKESPLLDVAVEALYARHLGGAGHPPSCSQTPSSPQTCWAAYRRQVARSGGGQLISGLNYSRVEEVYGRLETQSDSEYDSDPAMNESIKAWMKKKFSDNDDSDDVLNTIM